MTFELTTTLSGIRIKVKLDDKRTFEHLKKYWEGYLSTQEPTGTIAIEIIRDEHIDTRFKEEQEEKVSYEDNILTFSNTYKKGTYDFQSHSGKVCAKISRRHPLITITETVRTIYNIYLLEQNKLLMHASALEKDNEARLFIGTSGAGKSTIIKKNKQHKQFGDDHILAYMKQDSPHISSTMFHGEYKTRTEEESRLHSIYVLEKNKTTNIEKIKNPQTIYTILNNSFPYITFRKSSSEPVKKAMEPAAKLCETTPIYRLSSQKDDDIYKVIP